MSEMMKIQDWDIFSILNHIYKNKRPIFHINIPYQKEPLVRAELKSNRAFIRLNYSSQTYKSQLENTNNSSLERELPSHNQLHSMLVQSGILEYSNLDAMLKTLYQLCNRDFMSGDRPVYMGLDTNLFRDRFYTTQYEWLKRLPHNRIGVSVSPYVTRQLDAPRKYKEKHIHYLKDICEHERFRRYFWQFFNQNYLEDRLRRIGYVEIEKARRLQWIILLSEMDEDELQDNSDSNIILNYKMASEERNVDIFLLSRDDAFIGQAEGIPGLHPFFVDLPKISSSSIPVKNWYNLVQFIYVLTILYGIIELETDEFSLIFLGIWRGKRNKDWKDEALKLILPRPSDSLFPLIRNLKTLQQMKWVYE